MCYRVRTIIVLIAIVLAVVTAPAAVESQPPSPSASLLPVIPPADLPAPGTFAPGRVLVRWRDGVSDARLALALHESGWPVMQMLEPLHVAVVQTPPGRELAAIAELRRNPLVVSAEPDYLAYAVGRSTTATTGWSQVSTPGYQPNDTYWVNQWAARRIQAPAAWEIAGGIPGVVVAVVDSGIDLGHPEFAGRLLPGYDYVNQDSVPQDDYGHGTHVAGIIAAAGDNDQGVAGLDWKAYLLPVKVLDNSGAGAASTVALGVLYAISQNAAIVNLSLALTGHSDTLHDAIKVAYGNGALVIAATGNEGGAVSYPAAYPETVAVAATTHWDDWANYSNYGPEVDLAAPGGEAGDQVFSTSLNSGYGWLHGTSMAAAYVTGVASLLRAMSPSASNVILAGTLRNTADKVGSQPYTDGRNDRLGYGRVNASQALRQILPPDLDLTPNSLSLLAEAGGSMVSGTTVMRNASSQPLSWQLTEITEDWLDVDAPWSGVLAYPNSATLRVRQISPLAPGTYDAFVRIRSTTIGGQQEDHFLAVNLNVVTQTHRTLLPLVSSNHLVTSWVDASAGGLGISLTDDSAQVVGLPFTFPYYGVGYNELWVHANGFLSFGQGYAGSQYAANGCVPSLTAPNGAIYGLWDDLNPGLGGQVTFRNMDNDYAVVEWRDVPSHGGSAPNTFEILLWPDGRVLVQYQEIAYAGGVTVGLENWDASMGWQVACNGAGELPAPGATLRFQTALP